MTKTADDFSRAFYPFLHAGEGQPRDLMDELRFSLMEKVRESVEVKTTFFNENKDAILSASRVVAESFRRGGRLFVCGNGGSATDAQHVAVEFLHPVTVGRKALPAFCLSNDQAMMTAVANDVGFDSVFTRQLIALAREGDSLVGISTSGNSGNLLHAFETARRMKLVTVGFAGGDGGRMHAMCAEGSLDFCLTVPTSSVHRIQETHVALYHVMWDMVHAFLQQESFVGVDGTKAGDNR